MLFSYPNVWNTCLLILRERGYRLYLLSDLDEWGGISRCTWNAEAGDIKLRAKNPIELLGLAAIREYHRPTSDSPYWWRIEGEDIVRELESEWRRHEAAEADGHAMSDDDVQISLARLEGFLKAFEWFNHKTNHGCSYFILQLPTAGSVVESLSERFGLPPSAFRVEEILDVERGMRAVLARFLFLFQEPHGDHLIDPRKSFSLFDDFGRAGFLDGLAGEIRSLGVRAAWRVVPEQECGELREWGFQDDVVLDLADRRCLLHFGVSD